MLRLLHLSDTHGKHHLLQNLPVADIIIHSGDVSWAGSGKEVVDFVDWFGALNYRYKIFIAGNHDGCLDGKNAETIQRFLPENCFYLCKSGVTIEGLKFWGVPFFFSDDVDRNPAEIMAQIPADTDVLITHRPPYGILDVANNIAYGCPDLLQAVLKIAPRYHLFGHIHDAYGVMRSNSTIFCNGSLLDEDYVLVNEAVVFSKI